MTLAEHNHTNVKESSYAEIDGVIEGLTVVVLDVCVECTILQFKFVAWKFVFVFLHEMESLVGEDDQKHHSKE